MNKYNCQVDIVIPVYNALEDLKKCVLSVLKNTDLKTHRLILINDKSTDEKIKAFFSELVQDGIYKIENDVNLGFSGSINKGIVLSNENDVILLNSDTIVTPNWVDDLIDCAYMEENIGTVTPLSNNASICSVPYSNQDNPIPENISIDEYARELKRISLHQFPDLPVGIGFCMYIKRDVIDDVGLFDGASFGKGYGEENDFCNRATQLGYRHVLCDTVFIYHKGTASFVDEKKRQLIKEHEQILEERYPNLNRKLEQYWVHHQNALFAKNVELYTSLKLNNNKRNILYHLQADFQKGCSNNIGGTQLHVKDLVDGLKKGNNVFVAARDGELLRVTAYIGDDVIPFKFYIGPISDYYNYRDKSAAQLYRNLLLAFKIDLVHIHHTMGLTLDLYYMANELNIPIFITLHDYYYICPTLQLLDREKKVCVGQDNQDECKRCMKEYYGIYGGVNFIEKWRKEHAKVLSLCEKIITPSKSAADIILQYYPDVIDKIEIIGHGIDDSLFSKELTSTPYKHKELHIAFVGGICETKGSVLIQSLISDTQKDIKWFIFGGIDGKELLQLKQNNLIKTGWYQREDLKNLLIGHEIDIVCILSMIPETYCYTLSEVIACGVPAIVTDIGALGERMRAMKCGWIVPRDIRSHELLGLLAEIKNNPEDYNRKYYETIKYKMKSTEEMVAEYDGLYKVIKKRSLENVKFDTKQILYGYIGNNDYNSDELMSKVNSLKNELEMVYESELYKVLKRLATILDFGKRLLKRVR